MSLAELKHLPSPSVRTLMCETGNIYATNEVFLGFRDPATLSRPAPCATSPAASPTPLVTSPSPCVTPPTRPPIVWTGLRAMSPSALSTASADRSLRGITLPVLSLIEIAPTGAPDVLGVVLSVRGTLLRTFLFVADCAAALHSSVGGCR